VRNFSTDQSLYVLTFGTYYCQPKNLILEANVKSKQAHEETVHQHVAQAIEDNQESQLEVNGRPCLNKNSTEVRATARRKRVPERWVQVAKPMRQRPKEAHRPNQWTHWGAEPPHKVINQKLGVDPSYVSAISTSQSQ
jgi:hypothetical protein